MAKEQTGIAGEYWFFSQLQRLGYKSYITLGNTKSVDISVELNNEETITFDVKSKENFNGSFQYLNNVPEKANHFAVFVNLQSKKDGNGKTILLDSPSCYIVNSLDIKEIAFNWTSSTGSSSGYGFEAKLLWWLKQLNLKSITLKNISDFKIRHNIESEIDFEKYENIIMTLDDFEDRYYTEK